MKRKIEKFSKKFFSIVLIATLLLGMLPDMGPVVWAADDNKSKDCSLDNGYIKVDVSGKNGGFDIRTVKGDKFNKADDNKKLLFHNDDDDTSFTSFQVTRNGDTKEYIFGEKYDGSSDVVTTKADEKIISVWSVDQLTFTQTISLINTGASEHGMAYINYSVSNQGEAAEIKTRVMMDTALGSQDYAYYNVGDGNNLVQSETTLSENGYNKSFYAYDNPGSPNVTAYIVNASINNAECAPYQTTFAHWNDLAATVFDYQADNNLDFTNKQNKKYLTADSAVALYYNMGQVGTGESSTIATNYGVFSNEKANAKATVTVNAIAPDVLEFSEDKTSYKDDGQFEISTSVKNVGKKTYNRVRVVVYTTNGIKPLNEKGEDVNATYDKPYTVDFSEFVPNQTQTLQWKFKAAPHEDGEYATVRYKVYDVSDNTTQNTNELIENNLIGEGTNYILCPGTVNSIPEIQFTGSSPDILYNKGTRNLYITGTNFSMLEDKSKYNLMLSRVDGQTFDGRESVKIPSDNIKIDTAKNVMTVVLNEKNPGVLPEGQYQLKFDYTDTTKEDLSAPALRFFTKDDEAYRNDLYGVLAVIKDEYNTYHTEAYADEASYNQAISDGEIDRTDALLEFRGSFTKKDSDNSKETVFTGVSLSSNDNVMTLNNCIDIEKGTVTIREDSGTVLVDFDANLYLSGVGTKVYGGVCALTALEAGTEYGLIPYNEEGEREDFDYETITLLWPCIGQAAQNLMGMLMDFQYGELGAIEHENADATRVVAFGASMKLGFIIPGSSSDDSLKSVLGDAYYAMIEVNGSMSADDIRALSQKALYNSDDTNRNKVSNTDDEDRESKTVNGSVAVRDVLFGGRYIGLNIGVQLTVPSLVEGMPEIEGELTVKTVGDWQVGLNGSCDFSVFSMEADILIKSKNGIPVPDKLTFFIGDMVPGINLDGYGVIWLQGAGGGIDNLYDTIFLKDGIPPLKLIISAQMSLMQVISAKATLSLSLRGIGAELTDGKICNEIEVLNRAGLEFEWYPDFYFLSSVDLNILDVINGSGYITVQNDGFFEFFVRAALLIPEEVPVIGGTAVGSVGLGANKNKIWGQIQALCVKLGVVYYWGGKVEWGSGAHADPTFPELLGESNSTCMSPANDQMVYYDQQNDRALYMHVGTNVVNSSENENVQQITSVKRNTINCFSNGKMNRSIIAKNALQTAANNRQHLLSLAPKEKDEMVLLEWNANSRDQALMDVNEFKVTDFADNTNKYKINLLDHNKTVEKQEEANANLTYNEETKKATLALTFTKESDFNKEWKITTNLPTSIVLYDIEDLPELSDTTKAEINNADSTATVTLHGQGLNKYNNINFIAVPKAKASSTSEQDATLVYKATSETGFTDGNVIQFKMPENLQSGDYTLEIVATDNESIYQSEIDKDITYENANQPKKPGITNVTNDGDYKLKLDITNTNKKSIDGYSVTIYDADGNPVQGIEDALYTSDGEATQYDDDGNIILSEKHPDKVNITVGGQYSYTDQTTGTTRTEGLKGGHAYTVGVKAWKKTDTGFLFSEEIKQKNVVVNEPVKTKIDFTADKDYVIVTTDKSTSDGKNIEFNIPTFKDNNLAITVNTDTKITGTWTLDGGNRDKDKGNIDVASDSFTLNFTGLDEGTHTLEIRGKNTTSDAVSDTYTFAVDTMGPKLLLSSPISGSTFDDNGCEVKIQGITDSDSIMNVTDETDNRVLISNEKVEVNQEGLFEKYVTVDGNIMCHKIMIEVKDQIGNITSKEVLVNSEALGKVKTVQIWSDTMDITNKKISQESEYPLTLKAQLEDGRLVEINNSSLIEWQANTLQGEATLSQQNGEEKISLSEDAEGIITARYLVSDFGSNSAVAAFGNHDGKSIDEDNSDIVVSVDDEAYYTGKECRPEIKIYDKDKQLVEGTDYSLNFENNVEVSSDDKKASVTITGQGDYKGSRTIEYTIKYLDDTDTYSVLGTKGNDDWYISDVDVTPAEGYEISAEQLAGYGTVSMEITDDGQNSKTYYIRRISDGAISDKITVDVKIDKTAPKGTISVKCKAWSKFFDNPSKFTFKSVKDVLAISSKDAGSGIENVQYAIAKNQHYKNVNDLINADLTWKDYSVTSAPEIEDNVEQVVYVKLSDKAGNVCYISSEGILVDTIAPEITNVKIKDDKTLKDTQADIQFTVNEEGNYYYVVIPSELNAPSAEDVITGNIKDAVTGHGKITTEKAKKAITVTVKGLKQQTSYMLYVVAQDKAVNTDTGKLEANNSGMAVCDKAVTTLKTKEPETETTTKQQKTTEETTTAQQTTTEETTTAQQMTTGETTTAQQMTTEETTTTQQAPAGQTTTAQQAPAGQTTTQQMPAGETTTAQQKSAEETTEAQEKETTDTSVEKESKADETEAKEETSNKSSKKDKEKKHLKAVDVVLIVILSAAIILGILFVALKKKNKK